jgi:hypothetical protein
LPLQGCQEGYLACNPYYNYVTGHCYYTGCGLPDTDEGACTDYSPVIGSNGFAAGNIYMKFTGRTSASTTCSPTQHSSGGGSLGGGSSCSSGYCGSKNGGGPSGACCSGDDDYQDSCSSNGKSDLAMAPRRLVRAVVVVPLALVLDLAQVLDLDHQALVLVVILVLVMAVVVVALAVRPVMIA